MQKSFTSVVQPHPYHVIANDGFGISYSSLEKIGEILPSEPFGQGRCRVFCNVANGNLIIQDHAVQASEIGGPIVFQMVYNSLDTKQPWRLALNRKITVVPPNPEKESGTFELEEADGHSTTYSYGPSNKYWAPGSKNGRASFEFINEQWHRYDPATGESEYYEHPSGLLKESRDMEGRGFTYEYNSQNQLVAIQSTESLNRYKIDRGKNLISIIQENGSGSVYLQQYELDDAGRLVATHVPKMGEGYVIRYSYAPDGKIEGISQSDGTAATISYNRTTSKVSDIRFGESPGLSKQKITQPEIKKEKDDELDPIELVKFDYSDPNRIKVSDEYLVTFIGLAANQVKSIDRYPGCTTKDGNGQNEAALETTQYSYNQYGQLTGILRPDRRAESFTYTNDPKSVLETHLQPNGQLTKEVYVDNARTVQHLGTIRYVTTTNNQEKSSLSNETKEVKNQLDPTTTIEANTVYVYEFSTQNKINKTDSKDEKDNLHSKSKTNQPTVKLSFIVSPAGQVTQLLRNDRGEVVMVRVFLKDLYPGLSPEAPPDNNSMLKWANDKLQNTSLVQFDRDIKGRIINIKCYANVNSDGTGVEDAAMSLDTQSPDVFDNLVKLNTLYDASKPAAKTSQDFDALHRLLQRVDALKNQINYQYKDAQSAITKTYPNQRQETQIFSASGKLKVHQESADVAVSKNQLALTNSEVKDPRAPVVRTITCGNSAGGFPVLRKLADGRYEFSIYDLQQRLAIEITHSGITSRTQYDGINRYQQTIHYSVPINTWDFFDPTDPESLPDNSRVLAAIKKILPDDKARSKYEFKDESNRLHYEVDEENYLVEHLYDSLDRPIGIIKYKNQITADQLNALKNGQALNLPFDPKQDRYQQSILDLDGRVIMEVDPDGYVTQYNRDAGGRILEKIIYQKNIPVVINGNPKPIVDPQDAHSYYSYDARGQCIAEVDAEGYYTEHSYYPNGKPQSSKTYYNKISDANLQNTPTPHSEDQTTNYTYDALGRLIQVDGPSGKSSLTTYDNMGQIIANKTFDRFAPNNIKPDYQRGTQSRYDAFGQVIAQANPFVNDLLSHPGVDQEKIWATQSLRNTFDPISGLKLQSTDPLGNTTTYFYDQERRPLYVIGPTGIVVQTTYNNFNEIIQSRVYANQLSQDQIKTLKGGFITEEVTKLFIQDPAHDQITQFVYNARGLLIKKIDPEGAVFEYTYNAFKQCEMEIKPLSPNQNIKVIHEYDGRDHEIKTTTTSSADPKNPQPGDLVTLVQREYNNPQGKQTALIDECGNRSETMYDRRGDVKQTITAAQREAKSPGHVIVRDAFRRVLTETDSLGKNVTHTYDQVKRTHTINASDGVTKTITSNVFGETIVVTNALQQIETWEHAPDGQVKKYTDALSNESKEKNPSNQFEYSLIGQTLQTTDENQIVDTKSYDAAGYLQTEVKDVNGLKLTTTTKRLDGVGGRILVTDPMKVQRLDIADRCGRTTQSIIDANPTHLQMKPEGVRAYLKVQLEKARDLDKEQLKDTPHLQLLTQKIYNQQGDEIAVLRGDVSNPNQSNVALTRDALNRSTGKIIDPSGLRLQTSKKLDLSGKTITEIDPNGNKKWHFYDTSGRKNFTIDAEGGVQQWTYDTEDRCSNQRVYEVALALDIVKNFTEQTSLEQVKNLVSQIVDVNDTIVYFFYDDRGYERFKVTNKGAVSEKIYDQASREIQQIRYATRLDEKQPPITDFNTETLAAWMQRISTVDDRKTYFVLDAKGQQRFIIDPKGYITEKCFDAKGNEIVNIAYATKLPENIDPASIAELPEDKVRAKLASLQLFNQEQDRVTYQIYDSMDRLRAKINGEAAITRFDFDANGNQLTVCKFADRASSIKLDPNQPLFTDYNQLVAEVVSRIPDPINKKDRLTLGSYDAANRKISTTVTLSGKQYSDLYQLNALGNIQSHTDKLGNKWQQEFDTAERVTATISPKTKITEGIPDPSGANKFVIPKETSVPITCRTEYDAVGNEKVLTQAIVENQATQSSTYEAKRNTGNLIQSTNFQARVLQCEYNSYGKVTRKIIPQVAIDDPSQDAKASIKSRPEKIVDLMETTTYNGKQKAVVEQDNIGNITFNIYDLEGNLCFEVKQMDTDKPGQFKWKITETVRNAFAEVIQTIDYANAIYFQPTDVEKVKGVSSQKIRKAITPSPEDRTIKYQRDKRGDIVLIEDGPVFNYSPTLDGPPIAKLAVKRTKKDTNAFGEEVYTAQRLIDAKTGNDVWAENITWRDRAGQISAVSDPLRFVKRSARNAFGEEEKRTEYSMRLPTDPKPMMSSLNALDKALDSITNQKDKKFAYSYDQAGNTIKFTRVGVIRQQAQFDEKNIPTISDLPAQDLSQTFTYNALGKCTSSTDEAGRTKYFYWDERGLKVAETDIPRVNDPRTGVVVIPLTYFYYNAAGQPAGQTEFYNGAVKADLNTFPQVKQPDPRDRTKLEIHDKRGTTIWQQDYAEWVTGYTFNKNGKESRKYYQITNLQEAALQKMQEAQVSFSTPKVEVKQDLYGEGPKDLKDSSPVKSKIETKDEKPLTISEAKANAKIHIDEVRRAYSTSNQATMEAIFRDGKKVKTTQNYYNIFDEQTDQGDGSNIIFSWKRGPTGQVYATNESGVWKVSLHNLKGEVTSTMLHSTIDLSKFSYGDLAALVTQSLTDVNLLKTEMVRDLVGQSRITIMPWYYKTTLTPESKTENKGEKTAQANVKVTPFRRTAFNAWGSVISRTDARGFTTTYELNDLEQNIREVTPPVSVILRNNTEAVRRLIDRFAYNTKGQLIGFIDRNDNTTGYKLNAAGQILHEAVADGYFCSKSYGLYGLEGISDKRKNWWTMVLDKQGRTVASIPPSGTRQERFVYNELGNRIAQVYPDDTCEVYILDPQQNVRISIEPLRQLTRRVFNWNNLQVKEVNPDHSTRTWEYTLQGLLIKHTDLAGVPYTYRNDLCGRVIKQFTTGATGKHGQIYENKPTPDQNLEFIYDNGECLMRVKDNACNMLSIYEYNEEKQRIKSSVKSLDNSIVYQDASNEIDSLGREKAIKENIGKSVQCRDIAFDGVGNIRRTNTNDVSRWSTFDVLSRPLILYGSKDNDTGKIIISFDCGSLTSYENGYPKKVITLKKERLFINVIIKNMQFDQDGYFTHLQVTEDSGAGLPIEAQEVRRYSIRGWPEHADLLLPKFPFKKVLYDATRNANGWELQTINGKATTTVNPQDYTPMGLMKKQTIVAQEEDPEDPKKKITITTYYTNIAYVGFDDYQTSFLGGYTDNSKTGRGPETNTIALFNPNGGPGGTIKTESGAETEYRLLNTTYDNKILRTSRRKLLDSEYTINLFSPGGVYWGSCEFDRSSPDFFMSTLYKVGLRGGTYVIPYTPGFGGGDFYSQQKIPFDVSFPPPLPRTCQVTDGDTFEIISERFCGDTGMAAMLAIANGYAPGDTPKPNRKLNIPNIFTQGHIDHRVHPSYQVFLEKMRGSLSPNFKLAKPKEDFWKIVVGVVAGALVMIAAPWLSGFVIQYFAVEAAGIAFGITAATGTLLSLIEQKIVTGDVSIVTALKTGVFAGVNGLNLFGVSDASFLELGQQGSAVLMEQIGKQVLTAATLAVSDQLFELARTGKFDLTQIMASIAAKLFNKALPGAENAAGKFAVEMVGQAGSTALNSLITNRPISGTAMAAQALGTGMVLGASALFKKSQEAMENAARDQKQTPMNSPSYSNRRNEAKSSTPVKPSIPAKQTGHKQMSLEELVAQQELIDSVEKLTKTPLPNVSLDPNDPRFTSMLHASQDDGAARLKRYQQKPQLGNKTWFDEFSESASNTFSSTVDSARKVTPEFIQTIAQTGITEIVTDIGNSAQKNKQQYAAAATQAWNRALNASDKVRALEKQSRTMTDVSSWIAQKQIMKQSFNAYDYNKFFSIASGSVAVIAKGLPLVEFLKVLKKADEIKNAPKAKPNDEIWFTVREGGAIAAGGIGGLFGAALASPSAVFPPAAPAAVVTSAIVMGAFASEGWKTVVDFVHPGIYTPK